MFVLWACSCYLILFWIATNETYLQKNDPVEKAKRQKIRGKLMEAENSKGEQSSLTESENCVNPGISSKKKPRKAIPAKIRHQVHLRDGGRCCYTDPKGRRCTSSRYLETHHIKEVSRGGENTLENLITLCSGHHTAQHLSRPSPWCWS